MVSKTQKKKDYIMIMYYLIRYQYYGYNTHELIKYDEDIYVKDNFRNALSAFSQ